MSNPQNPSAPPRILASLCDKLDLTLVQRSGEIANPTGQPIPMDWGYVIVVPKGLGLTLHVFHNDGSEQVLRMRDTPVFGRPGGRPSRFRTFLVCPLEINNSGVRCGLSMRSAYRPPGGRWGCAECNRVTWRSRTRGKTLRYRIEKLLQRLRVEAAADPDITRGGARLTVLRRLAKALHRGEDE